MERVTQLQDRAAALKWEMVIAKRNQRAHRRAGGDAPDCRKDNYEEC